ncbi:hypothetical protein B0O80DRAFT_231437 [Mortierella sp. GBAus27b]|nr:hypothetical protein B0O80DRAFT_231437 [Mortierella sp. GBAus27b]
MKSGRLWLLLSLPSFPSTWPPSSINIDKDTVIASESEAIHHWVQFEGDLSDPLSAQPRQLSLCMQANDPSFRASTGSCWLSKPLSSFCCTMPILSWMRGVRGRWGPDLKLATKEAQTLSSKGLLQFPLRSLSSHLGSITGHNEGLSSCHEGGILRNRWSRETEVDEHEKIQQ